MRKKIYIHSAYASSCPPQYPQPKFHTSNLLTEALAKKGIKICLGKILKGGTVSQVYEAQYQGQSVIVKHTETLLPFDPTELSINQEGHNTDIKVLSRLQKSTIKVPRIIKEYRDIHTTIMEDLRNSSYSLFSPLILMGQLPLNSAKEIGKSLAALAQESRAWKIFKTNESAQENIYERGLELRLAYPNTQKEYLSLEKEYVSSNKYWVWPDGHSKNMFINQQGKVAFIDFGRSHWGDQRFMLPNFLAHIVLYGIAGYLKKKTVVKFLKETVLSYAHYESIDESLFCKYLAMEVLHRSSGKWVEGIKTKNQKVALYNFGLSVFDDNLDSIDKLLGLIKRSIVGTEF